MRIAIICFVGTMLLQAAPASANASDVWYASQVRHASQAPAPVVNATNKEQIVYANQSTEEPLAYAHVIEEPWADCCECDSWHPSYGRRGCGLIGSTCTMSQHHYYYNPMSRYYYFHPYHHSHVRSHQMFGQLWGEHPANPYANQVFESVFQQYRDDTARN